MNEENLNADQPEFSWPKKGDVLFKQNGSWPFKASLNSRPDGWEIYAIGYKEAADILVKQINETHFGADMLVYPIVFLYRHYLELRLKELITSGQRLLDHEPDLDHIHKLDELWRMTRKILEEVWPGKESEALAAVESCMKEFNKIDPQSYGFRYPMKKSDGSLSVESLQHLDIHHFHKTINSISNFLVGSSSAIYEYLQIKGRLNSELIDEMRSYGEGD